MLTTYCKCQTTENMNTRKSLLFLLLFILPMVGFAVVESSVAGFIQLQGSGRQVYNFNPGWRFSRGDVKHAETTAFDDSAWEVVSTPHTVELMPAEASGCRNYQGIAWYRKHFVVPAEAKGKDVTIHFEAIMGKQNIYLNGKLVKEHMGGYLPITIPLTGNGIFAGDTCLIAVMADNSDDKTFPPGKPQYTLDFAYHGGIYRDAWMISKNKIAITDAIEAGEIAGGGVFVHYDNISEKSARVFINTEIKNNGNKSENLNLETILLNAGGIVIRKINTAIFLKPGEAKTVIQQALISNPHLWSPDAPYLYRVNSIIKEGKKAIDGGTTRIGIRKAEFRGKDGFYLNGKPYGQLIGANRHQDFAYVGNALPNSQQWRDAKRLRDAGCTIIRTAHYPQDPAFMDACDELGLFIIVATPGWQYWNKDPKFEQQVYDNTRNLIRRDRNHTSVLMWEPILNETRYPLNFSINSLKLTREEFPYPGAPVAVADLHSEGVADNYEVVYGWPTDEGKATQSIFTREFGENVDDWYGHNNNNRASRSWGERPQIVQALSLAQSYDAMSHTTGQFIGGAQWHPFDHQRGYHPDPYWGGIFDAFRQPKYAYYMFKSQADPAIKHSIADDGPMVYITNEMTPFSDAGVVVFSNCDSVRLTAYEGKSWTKPVLHEKGHIPYAPVTFEKVFDFWEAREFSYVEKKWQKVSLLAEGFIGGKVVCSEKKMPSRRSTKIRLTADTQKQSLVADGSDFIVVVAEITDDSGNVRRLAKDNIVFTVEGEGEIIGDEHIGANPRAVEFGSAPALIRSTRKAGKIKIKAHVQFEGTQAPTAAELEIESIPSTIPFCFIEQQKVAELKRENSPSNKKQLTEDEKQKLLIEVERQQTEFGEKKIK